MYLVTKSYTKKRLRKEPFWKIVLNAESKISKWEIVHHEETKNVWLHYVHEEVYSEKDIKINLTYEEFEDLIGFIKKMDSKYY